MHPQAPDTVVLGLKLGEWFNFLGLLLGPVVAVLVTLWIDSRRRRYERKITILRTFLATRHLPADPNFSTAINLVPIEFAKSVAVQQAYREFVDAANAIPTPENQQAIGNNVATKITRLVYEIARDVGLQIRETDLQTQAYSSSGSSYRDALLQDSQRAMRDIATTLHLQARLMTGAPLHPNEKQALGLPDQEQ
ncbi:DUF6680 family protein [Sphingomonas sp. GlSt437]|uniref:DUF6680 family protein n=1 Tax=Sphingomonas sp. GlSt437 TaxID=3389970 RepID=UPI003A89CCB4